LIFFAGRSSLARASRFTLMYLMFVLVGAGGLIVTANLAPIVRI
jgi:hypothetical protein